ncbi:DUF1910 domain-containing protein [Pelistega sp. NLN82]|uniref:DUF1910 domain-containing protein n=1 Tax=Pelistega ratti TaxID=2652177 RepID=A0A6L9Y9G1_9BURK|nr:DUF1910 domain-containing protein [Pelistega ratti]NEN76428.1 DUF1910 domain-containing protein [Pelistega ratti]
MNFTFNPRQIFIRQANAERTIDYGIEGIQFYNDKLKLEDPNEKYLYTGIVDNLWMLLRIYYTVGEDIEKLPPLLEQMIESAEIGTKVWQENKHLLSKEQQNLPPYAWYTSLNYLNTLGYISMYYLLHREDLLERLLNVILANENVDGSLDGLIEDLFYYHLKDRPEENWVPKEYIIQAIDSSFKMLSQNESLKVKKKFILYRFKYASHYFLFPEFIEAKEKYSLEYTLQKLSFNKNWQQKCKEEFDDNHWLGTLENSE